MPWLILLFLRLILLIMLLIRRATFTVALALSPVIAASTYPAPPALTAASGFETIGQGMAAVVSVQAPVERFHVDETTLQVTQTEICFQRKVPFLGSMGGGEIIQNPTANILLCDFNTVALYVESQRLCSGNV